MQRKWSNFHTHTSFSDGSAEPEVYVRKAIDDKMRAIGFSEHAPLPFRNDWAMQHDNMQNYNETLEALKQKYKDSIAIYKGLEIDFIPGISAPGMPDLSPDFLDYCIGSVHIVGRFEDGKYFNIDTSTQSKFDRGFSEIHGNDIRGLTGQYFDNVCDMVENHTPDIIAHLDLIKMNTSGKLFDESEEWYRRKFYETLEVISQTDVIVELNTGGITRKRFPAPYPDEWALKQCLKLGIPTTISSDTHTPGNILGWVPQAAQLLMDIGYQEIYVLKDGKWVAETIDGI